MNIRDVDVKVLEFMLEDFYPWWRDGDDTIYEAAEFYIPWWRQEVDRYRNIVDKKMVWRNGVLITFT